MCCDGRRLCWLRQWLARATAAPRESQRCIAGAVSSGLKCWRWTACLLVGRDIVDAGSGGGGWGEGEAPKSQTRGAARARRGRAAVYRHAWAAGTGYIARSQHIIQQDGRWPPQNRTAVSSRARRFAGQAGEVWTRLTAKTEQALHDDGAGGRARPGTGGGDQLPHCSLLAGGRVGMGASLDERALQRMSSTLDNRSSSTRVAHQSRGHEVR
jgi:hypothetical protein